MKALFDFIPAYCPNCGANLGESFKNRYALKDYQSQSGFTCDCGMRFKYAPFIDRSENQSQGRANPTEVEFDRDNPTAG